MQSNGGRVLIYDIETMANTSYVWGHYDQNVIRHKHPWHVLSFAWKWLDEDEVHYACLRDFPSWKRNRRDDKALCKVMWELFEEADVIVAHNGNNFDVKKMWSRFMVHDFGPPSRPFQVDTKLAAKRGRFNSNSLKDLAEELGLTDRKLDHGLGFDLWLGCMDDDDEMWAVMEEYNRLDVIVLEQLYLRLRPYMTNHPNMNVMTESRENTCHICGSEMKRNGYRYTAVSRFQRWRCKDRACRAESKSRLSFDTMDTRPKISR